jgi:hypothetical protein
MVKKLGVLLCAQQAISLAAFFANGAQAKICCALGCAGAQLGRTGGCKNGGLCAKLCALFWATFWAVFEAVKLILLTPV